MRKTKAAQVLALVHLLGLITITCGVEFNRSLGFIILSAIFFISGGLFWAIKGGLFE